MKVYLAGPMTGYPLFNFPAFDRYRDYLMLQGCSVISPADIDRKHGFDPQRSMEKEAPSRHDCAMRDVEAICGCDMVCVMPGWKSSKGVAMEMAVAKFIDIPIVFLDSLNDLASPYSKPLWASAGYEVT